MTFEQILDEVSTSKWQPEFIWVDSVEECADLINRPHEDYPLGVQGTIDMIREFEGSGMISWPNAQNIQKYVYESKNDGTYLNIGIRQVAVKVGDWVPPHPMFLPKFIDQIFPIFHDRNLTEWYKIFQTIHPFEDLNGRVGGIILAVLSFDGTSFLTVKR